MVVCSFCGNEFKHINKHLWRCEAKLEEINPRRNAKCAENQAAGEYKCICGKICKGLRGLKSHQRTCRSVKYLGEDVTLEEDFEFDDKTIEHTFLNELPNAKRGILLPKSQEQWDLANLYFQTEMSTITISKNANEAMEKFNFTIYRYFENNFGLTKRDEVTTGDINLINTYKDYLKSDIKRELKKMKSQHEPDINIIKFLSKLLRSKITKVQKNIVSHKNSDIEISKNFFGFCKRLFIKSVEILPAFGKVACENYFTRVLAPVHVSKLFKIPSWMKPLGPPTSQFNVNPVTYKNICKIIKRMKTSAAPCPLDQISVICLKRCPYLRSFLLRICNEVISTNVIPEAWTKAVTILIHKKGDQNLPENFRPITLEPVTLKVFTSIIRNQIYEFLLKNGYIESHFQKGFTPGITGTFEHISEMDNIINRSRLKQRSVVITLIDLRNAFGTVNHRLIQTVLKYHHIPQNICDIIGKLYNSFHISVITADFKTCYMKVNNGVLQGDCLSPLLFNMVINTFINSIKEETFVNFGVRVIDGFRPRNWFQFADDAAATTCLECENQLLLNFFSRWCKWADLQIRSDKCHSFGIKKAQGTSVQFKPKVYIDNVLVQALDQNESFLYLGRYFDFKMSDSMHKETLVTKIKEYMQKVDFLDMHPRNKILVYQKYILSKISWDLTVAKITDTWVKENLDSIVNKYLRSWLEIPISGTLKISSLSKSKYGLNITSISTRLAQCQVTFRKCLKNSSNKDINKIHEMTRKGTNIRIDNYVSTKDAIKKIREKTENEIKSELTTQSLVITAIWNTACAKYNPYWCKVLDALPKNLYSFCVRYLGNSLANGTNAIKWGITNSCLCLFCQGNQTLQHVISSCPNALREGRWNWRHDSILLNIARFLSKIPDIKIYCDVENSEFQTPSIITGLTERPDMIILKKNTCTMLELTVGFETNIVKNSQRKAAKYSNLLRTLNKSYTANYINLSMGAIGIIGNDSTNMTNAFIDLGLSEAEAKYIITKVINVCIRTTYFIFCQRNKEWQDHQLLTW